MRRTRLKYNGALENAVIAQEASVLPTCAECQRGVSSPAMDVLVPPPTKANSSVVAIRDDWYVVAIAEELKDKPLPVVLLGTPIVVFRSGAGIGALLDRCPHRNVPLSLGRVRGTRLECGYHGWQFDNAGQCQHIPGLCGGAETNKAARNAPAFAAREADGFIWVYGTPNVEPVRDPFAFPHLGDARYSTIRHVVELEGTMHAAAENALDVPHTAFLHRGLFRSEASRKRIGVEVRRYGDRVEAEYLGEPRPEGVIGRVLAPGGGVVKHHDRFILPCIAQVEYEIGGSSHVVATTALTPVRDHFTRMFAAVSFKLPFVPNAKLGEIAGRALKPLALRIVGQDSVVLRAQTRSVKRFGGEQFASTELDVLGPHILRLLRQAERGIRGDADELLQTKSLEMEV